MKRISCIIFQGFSIKYENIADISFIVELVTGKAITIFLIFYFFVNRNNVFMRNKLVTKA